ncbi:MAG: hypothetical protein KDD35_09985, partial [Bdellovibrionales bacterium]|nr:hypothetical protein [Bdellovibrionales bacterium]
MPSFTQLVAFWGLRDYPTQPMKYISSILVVSSLLWSSNSAFAHSGPESQCSEFLKDSSIPLDSAVENEELLGNAYPELVHTLRKEISSGRLSAEKVFFVLLPGNMGKHWEGTNHNVGYDLLLDLIQHYRAIGVDNGQQSYEVPIESVSFNANELVDEIDFPDMQNFFSQAGYARTKSGELFVARGNELQPTLVFMRRYGFYNDVGNFFVPTILEMGGNTQNIIVIHDDLKVPLGELSVEEGRATYDGNRAILSIHNNLNALSLKKKMNEARGRILEFLISPIKSQLALSAIKIDSLYRGLETLTWQVVVEAKNQMDPVQFKSLL